MMKKMRYKMNIKTDKDAFLFVAKRLIEQNAKCLNEQEDCVYRGYSSSFMEQMKASAYETVYGNDEDKAEQDNWGDGDDYFNVLMAEHEPNLKCAAGHLILDEFYDPNIEGEGISAGNLAEKAIIKSNPEWNYDGSSLEMIDVLQTVHDRRFTEDWPSLLEKLEQWFDEDGTYITNSVLSGF
jgi:hypothetical protein